MAFTVSTLGRPAPESLSVAARWALQHVVLPRDAWGHSVRWGCVAFVGPKRAMGLRHACGATACHGLLVAPGAAVRRGASRCCVPDSRVRWPNRHPRPPRHSGVGGHLFCRGYPARARRESASERPGATPRGCALRTPFALVRSLGPRNLPAPRRHGRRRPAPHRRRRDRDPRLRESVRPHVGSPGEEKSIVHALGVVNVMVEAFSTKNRSSTAAARGEIEGTATSAS